VIAVDTSTESRTDRSRIRVRTICAPSLLLLGVVFASVMAAQTTGEQKPPNISIDKGACPFECCTYREWVTRSDVTLFDSPNGKRVVGRVKKGQKVLALTGEVHSVPLRMIAHYDFPDGGVKKGDTVYLLHYVGEGYWKAWHDGKLFDTADFPDKGSRPKSTWWVKLKTSAGVIGWTVEHGNFENQDACG